MFSLGAPALQPFTPVKTKIILYYGMNKVTFTKYSMVRTWYLYMSR